MIFNMNNVKSIKIHLPYYFKISSSLYPSNKEENNYVSHLSYCSVAGSLMYAMVCTRLDISHAIGVVSRYKENLGRDHWETMKWVLQYLRGTIDYCITYNGCIDLVCSYVDSDFADDLDKRGSTSGYVLTLAGGPIFWMLKPKNIVTLSTTEEEYIVVSHSCKEAIWLKGLLGEFRKG
jgi:hypothetical protein